LAFILCVQVFEIVTKTVKFYGRDRLRAYPYNCFSGVIVNNQDGSEKL